MTRPKIWAKTILGVVRRHWQQWYVFEPLLTRVPRIRNGD